MTLRCVSLLVGECVSKFFHSSLLHRVPVHRRTFKFVSSHNYYADESDDDECMQGSMVEMCGDFFFANFEEVAFKVR